MALWLIALLHLVQASPDAEDLHAMAIVHKESGRCFQATASGVVLQHCQHTSSQHWYKHERMIVSLADGKCLEWDPSKNAEHDWTRGKVHMTECTGAPQQLWDFDAAGNVRNSLASSLCLEQYGNAIGVFFCYSGHGDQHFELNHMRLKTPAQLQKLFKPRKEKPPEAKAEPERSHKESMLETKLEQAKKVLKDTHAELKRMHAGVNILTEHIRLEELEKKRRTVNGEQEPKAQINLAELLKMDHTKDVQSAFIESLAKCLELRLVYVGFPLALFFALFFFWRQPREDLKRDLLKPLHEEIQEMRKSQGLAAELELRRLGQVQEKDKEGQLQQVLMQLVIEMKESRKERDTYMTLLKQLQETVAGSDASSECTVGSWALVSSGEPCCFLPDTQFKVQRGDRTELVPAQSLFQGAEVIAANGTAVKVLHPPELHQVDAVLQLHAGQSSLVVSPEHRIFVPGNKTVEAHKLEAGNEVILDGTRATLTSLTWKVEPTVVLKISFTPDLAIATWPPSILSKGSRAKPRSRRGKKEADALSIPDTEGHLSN